MCQSFVPNLKEEPMLVLSRKIGERIVIDGGIELSIVDVRGGRVRIGIEAPRDVPVRRFELVDPPCQTQVKLPQPIAGLA
jgi:carbon storage regulator